MTEMSQRKKTGCQSDCKCCSYKFRSIVGI